MKKIFLTTFTLLTMSSALAEGMRDPAFFPNDSIQRQAPKAYAIQPEARQAVIALHEMTLANGDALVEALRAKGIAGRLRSFPTLPLPTQKRILQEIFEVQTTLSGLPAPKLVIDENYERGAFFEFDTKPMGPGKNVGPGRVFNNPRSLTTKENPYGALQLLIHETRHSAQIQLANLPRNSPTPAYAESLKAAFVEQKTYEQKKAEGIRVSFLDFMTLMNEYEAFRFGNYVVGSLLGFAPTDDPGMGSFASQFNKLGVPKIALVSLFTSKDPTGRLGIRGHFDALEDEQYRLLRRNGGK